MTSSLGTTRGRRDTLDSFWHFLSATRTTAALLVILAATVAIAASFPQQPEALTGADAARWLATAASAYGGIGPSLRVLGVFDVLDGLWLRIVLAALAYNLALGLAAAAMRVRDAWRPDRPMPQTPPDLPTQEAWLASPLAAALPQVRDALASRHRAIVIESREDRALMYLGRHRLAVVGQLMLYAGPLLLLLGLLIDGLAGWRVTGIALAPKGSYTLRQANELDIILESVAGTERDASSTIVLREAAGTTGPVRLAYGKPARLGHLWIVQRTTGPALSVAAQDALGRPLLLQSLAEGGAVSEQIGVLFDQNQTEQAFALPTQNLLFRAVSYAALPESGIDTPVFLVEVYQGEETIPIVSQLVENEGTVSVAGKTVILRRERYVVLEAAYLPGMILLALGSLLLLVGVILALGWARGEAWVKLRAQGDAGVAVEVRTTSSTNRSAELARLVDALRNSVPGTPGEPAGAH